MEYSFRLSAWHVSSARMHTPQQWQDWVQGDLDPLSLPEHKPEAAFLPAMQRRRLGLSARLMFDAAHQLVGEQHCPLVSVSHDGEIARSFELWDTLLREGSVSPTSFGLSVHNALAGQWSMLRGDMSEHTALAVREAGLETGLAEAVAMLADGADKVLLVVGDEPVPERYPVAPLLRAPFAYALALLLEPGKGFCVRKLNHGTGAAPNYWGALSLVQHLLQGSQSWIHQYSDGDWQWQRMA